MATRLPDHTALPIAIALAFVLIPIVSPSGLCPPRCHCEDEYLRATCSNAGLDVVPIQLNPEIRHLDLSGNRVASLHLTFGFYDNLETLDLSSNLVHTLGIENFVLQQRLVNLNVSSNAIRTVAKNALKGLTSLRKLDLSDNNITDLDDQAFRDTSELEYLDLSGNSITSLPDGLLRNLHNIRIFVINRNSLLEMPSNNLALVPSLEELDLGYNLLQELVTDSTPTLRSLVSLNLANNVIRSIADDAFGNLPGLVYLNLEGNNLTNVPTESLSKLRALRTLNFGKNRFTEINTLAFRNLFELKNLDVSDCTITKINSRAFADNINLETIILDGNHDLKQLPGQILFGARNLKRVSLRHCSLSYLQPTDFPIDGLSSLRIGGNPLICNCSLHWLWNVIRSEKLRNATRLELDSDDVICTDEEFSGQPLVTLTEGSLRCRLSPLYLTLSAIGCVAATAAILALIVHVTRAKRRKRPAYAPPNRPELLVYVGRGNDEPDKNPESYSRRLIARNEEVLYDLPRGKPPLDDSPNRFENVISEPTSFYQTIGRYPRANCRESYTCSTRVNDSRDLDQRANNADVGVYAVADVTSLRDAPPEVLSLYRMHSPKSIQRSRFQQQHQQQQKQRQQRRISQTNGDYDYDYDYDCDYDYERHPAVPDKPHVVFV